MSGEELKPCPCCGSSNIIPPPDHWPDGCVYCRDCGLRANSPDAWNRRPEQPHDGGLREEEARAALYDAVAKRDPTGASRRKMQMHGVVDVGAAVDAIMALHSPISALQAMGEGECPRCEKADRLAQAVEPIILEMRDIYVGQAGYRTPGQIADAAWFTGQPSPGAMIPAAPSSGEIEDA